MVLNSYSSSSSQSKVNIEKNIVVKINKKEYVLIKLPVYPVNENYIKRLVKQLNAIIQNAEELEVGMLVTLLVPSRNLKLLEGEMTLFI